MTEGKLALTAPGGMAGSFLRVGERVVPGVAVWFGGSGREVWQQEEEQEEGRSRRCGSTDWLRLMAAGWRGCNGSDRVVRSV